MNRIFGWEVSTGEMKVTQRNKQENKMPKSAISFYDLNFYDFKTNKWYVILAKWDTREQF